MIQINESIYAIRSLGIPIPDSVVQAIIIMLFIALVLKALSEIVNIALKISYAIENRFYNIEDKQFVLVRNNFVGRLKDDVESLNSEANWSDFYYSDLEAEVEVDPSYDFDIKYSNSYIIKLLRFYHGIINIKNILKISQAPKIEKNLVRAIERSSSHAFLVIGDPGSGKTVSLRHLFLRLADSCISSKDKNAIVPIYLNLKHLNLKPDELSDDSIHKWIRNQLCFDKDRSILDFIDKNFENILNKGNFFFLFDSFDEIPSVMDSQEDQKIVQNYARILDGFIHSYKCKGLVSSRPYRAPKVFIGQKMIIRPLSDKRIKKALDIYLIQEHLLADQLWNQLSHDRGDLLYISRNPFYLGLLAGYAKDNRDLPQRHYDLFEYFVNNRATIDENRLRKFKLTPSELIKRASILAYALTRTPEVGLEAEINTIYQAISELDKHEAWDQEKVTLLINALTFSKLGKISQDRLSTQRWFSFIHRRFQEYFCARYIKDNPEVAPIEHLAADDRWREVLVLLCEVLPENRLHNIFEMIRPDLLLGINARSGSKEQKKAIEIVRFLRDGFRSRINSVPNDIKILCSKFIKKQLNDGNLLDKKRALEALILVDDGSIHKIIDSTLRGESAWLRETAIRSCRILQMVPDSIAESIRNYIYSTYSNLSIYSDYSSYLVLFSSPPALRSFHLYLRLILSISLIQVALFLAIAFYGIMFDILILEILLISSVLVATIHIINYTRTGAFYNFYHDISPANIIADTPWSQIAFIMIMLNFIMREGQSNNIGNILVNIFLIFIIIFNYFMACYILEYPQTLLETFSIPINSVKAAIGHIRWVDVASFSLFVGLIAIGLLKLRNIYLIVQNFILHEFYLAKAQGYSIINIYLAYGFIDTLLILLFGGAIISFCAVYLYFIIKMVKEMISYIYTVIYDQIKLRRLSMRSNIRPKTIVEAIQVLHTFKSDLGKVQYIRRLYNWLQSGDDLKILNDEANKHGKNVRDEIYKLLEIWDDTLPK